MGRLHGMLMGLAGLGLLLAGCGAGAETVNDSGVRERVYVEDEALEAFDRDLRALSLAIQTGNTRAEESQRAKLGEGARLYQRALLSALYDDRSTPRRALAAVLLGFTGDASVIQALMDVAQSSREPESVRVNALLGLATLGDKLRDYPDHLALMRGLSASMEAPDSSFSLRRAAVTAFVQAFDAAQGDSIIPLRNRFLSDPDQRVRIAAINAMGDIGDHTAVTDLVAAGLGDPEPEVRSASAIALGKITYPDAALPALVRASRDENSGVRRHVVDAASRHYGSEPETVYAVVITGLSDFDARVREAAALALARIEDERGVEPLLQATGDRVALVREAAARALGFLIPTEREKEAYPLIDLLTDQNPDVQLAALRSLSNITQANHANDQTIWRRHFHTKYPELDPARIYEGRPKPRIASGINTARPRTGINTGRQQMQRPQQQRPQQQRPQQQTQPRRR
jgi:HEAT repeat protein